MSQVPFIENGKFLGSVESDSVKQCKHPNRKDIGTCPDGCCDKYECLDCDKTFYIEVPD